MVKENRQGCLSRWIKRLFEPSKEVQKVQQPVEKVRKDFFDRLRRVGVQERRTDFLWGPSGQRH